MKELLSKVLTVPVMVVSFFTALAVAATFLFGDFDTPGEKMQSHIEKSAEIHEDIKKSEKEAHDSLGKSLIEADKHLEDINASINAVLRGECLENPRENLVRQGLIQKCISLGVVR